MNLPRERELSANQALARIQDDLDALGLRFRLEFLGEAQRTVIARLFDASGAQVSQGVGKGPLELATVGALFEALEHHCTLALHDRGGVGVESSHGFHGIERFEDEKVIRLLRQEPEGPLACRRYVEWGGDGTVSYPLFLTHPRYPKDRRLEGDTYDYRKLSRYAANSGTAIGATLREAFLHALNECLERDAVSLFLARHFYQERGRPLRVVDRGTLPRGLQDLAARAEAEVGAEVRLLWLPHDSGIPVFIAVARKRYPVQVPHGAGASLDAAHALTRALTELVQLDHVTHHLPEVARGQRVGADGLADFPALLRCFTFDLEGLLARNGSERVDFRDVPGQQGLGLEASVEETVARVRRWGRAVYSSNLHVTPSGTHVTTVLVPGLERFFLVTLGVAVLPSSRALTAEG
jgi:ribosomal protein S12 methylthiotransferase accessory factor